MAYKDIFGCISGRGSTLGGFAKFGETAYGLTMKGAHDTVRFLCFHSQFQTVKVNVNSTGTGAAFGGASVGSKSLVEGYDMSYEAGIDAKGKITGKYTVTNDSIMKGLKAIETMTILPNEFTDSGASVGLSYTSKSLSGEFTLGKQLRRTAPVKISFTGATEYMGFLFGFMKKYDIYAFGRDEGAGDRPKYDVTDMGIGCAYKLSNLHFAAGVLSNFKKFQAGVNYAHNDDLSFAVDFTQELEPAEGKTEAEHVVQVGTRAKLGDATIRAKVNSNAIASFGYEKKIAGIMCKAAMSTNLGDVTDTKLGLNFSVTE